MNKDLLIFLIIISLLSVGVHGFSQTTGKADTTVNTDDLEKILKTEGPSYASKYVAATFQSSRVINGQSIESTGMGVLDFRISHRFGDINEGVNNLFGLDNATTKFDFDYGITDWLTVGVGRNSYEKEYDGFTKIKILKQTTDDAIPVSVAGVGGISVRTLDVLNIPGYEYQFYDRLYYFSQAIIARKFNRSMSLQIVPTYIHYNLVDLAKDPNDVLAIGLGARMKVSKRIAVTGEYYYTIPGYKMIGYNNSVSIGVDIETGGHVFQLFFTNATGISERVFIAETQGNFLKGSMLLGFNISRVFTIVRQKNFERTDYKTQ